MGRFPRIGKAAISLLLSTFVLLAFTAVTVNADPGPNDPECEVPE